MIISASQTRILPLPQNVVDRIAAGEVIQRPFSAVKELIENSVDAGASQITITVKGSSSFLQVQDNGKGIHPEDLKLICRRFNTSKLRQFEDLKSMETYGFRGEALSSITHVARVTITSQQQGDGQSVSHRAEYCDGKMSIPMPIKCAGNPGTTITVEDLFYNVPQRLRGLKSSGEEYSKIIEVASKYAMLHSGKVGFTVKRAGVHTPDVHTLATASLVENIGKVYGSDVAKEWLEIAVTGEEFTLTGGMTNPNYSRKKGEFLLFINYRLVECSALKRICDAVYQECLPKGTHPFVYLKLDLPPQNVDVNIHPTKKEVGFLHEEEIGAALTKELKRLLLQGNASRTFELSHVMLRRRLEEEENDVVVAPSQVVVRPNKQVRTSTSSGSLERYLVSSSSSPSSATPNQMGDDDMESAPPIVDGSDAFDLESVHRLLQSYANAQSTTLTECLRRSVFVGVVDDTYSILQYDTTLVLVDHVKLSEEMYYQRALRLFGRFARIQISPPVDLVQLIGECSAKCIVEHRELLFEYFGLGVSAQGAMECIPILFHGNTVLPRALPALFRELSSTNWEDESECFRTVARAIARAYAQLPTFAPLVCTADIEGTTVSIADRSSIQHVLKNSVFPLVKQHLIAPRLFADARERVVVPLTSLEQLYKIFERC